MIEILDNALQLMVTTICAIWSGILAIKHKSQCFFVLACFYCTFALGLIFWLFYLVVMTYTPRFFYVSDLSWIASFMFLLLLNVTIAFPEERNYRPIAAWITVLLLFSVMVTLCFWGDLVVTLIWCGLTTACGYFSTRGLLYSRKQVGEKRRMQYLHIAILVFVFLEFTLWLLSCFFRVSTLANPYFWCDFAVTISLFALLPTAKKSILK